jgi:hypothetical protein
MSKIKKPKYQKTMDKLNILDRSNFANIYKKICSYHLYTPAIIPKQKRVVVLGDIHGDLKLAIQMLEISGVAKNDGKNITWIGGSTYVVQVGDQIDRCRPIGNMTCSNKHTTSNDEASDIKILELYTNLHMQAVKSGGAVISLLGNHELLNATSHMDYVSHAGLNQFNNYVDPAKPELKFNSGHDARIHAFRPGNQYGKYLGCTRLPAVIIGSNIFVHAGLVDGLISSIGLTGNNDFEVINQSIRLWLLGILHEDYIKDIINGSKYSMFWTRILGKIPPGVSLDNPVCSEHISKVLHMFNIGNIVIGHTPQSFLYSDDINSTCSNKIWRVDSGSSAAFNKFDREFLNSGKVTHSRRVQYLEIIDDKEYRICDQTGCKNSY